MNCFRPPSPQKYNAIATRVRGHTRVLTMRRPSMHQSWNASGERTRTSCGEDGASACVVGSRIQRRCPPRKAQRSGADPPMGQSCMQDRRRGRLLA